MVEGSRSHAVADADSSLTLSHSPVYSHEVGGGTVRRLLMSLIEAAAV